MEVHAYFRSHVGENLTFANRDTPAMLGILMMPVLGSSGNTSATFGKVTPRNDSEIQRSPIDDLIASRLPEERISVRRCPFRFGSNGSDVHKNMLLSRTPVGC